MRRGRSSGDNAVELVAESSQETPARSSQLGDHVGAVVLATRRSCGNTVEFAVEPAAVPPVIFAPDELEALRRGPQTLDLQRKAREGLEYAIELFNGHPDGNTAPPCDVTAVWLTWKLYIARHKQGAEFVGEGITKVQGEQIRGVTDPNRRGRLRVDIVLYNVDGGFWRLHPGSSRCNDAVPRHIAGNASELAGTMCAGVQRVYDGAAAGRIPQQDRLGRKEVVELLSSLDVAMPCDVTERIDFPRWRWFCNLGRDTDRVIGSGIARVILQELGKEDSTGVPEPRVLHANFHVEHTDGARL